MITSAIKLEGDFMVSYTDVIVLSVSCLFAGAAIGIILAMFLQKKTDLLVRLIIMGLFLGGIGITATISNLVRGVQ